MGSARPTGPAGPVRPAASAGSAAVPGDGRVALALACALTVPVAVVLWRSAYGPLAALPALGPLWLGWRGLRLCHPERAARQAAVQALAQAVHIKDRYTRGHGERVGLAAVMIARELGMDEERTETLRCAGVLHDVGKLGVPARLLRKAGPLTPAERRVMEQHPEHGAEIVRGLDFLGEARAAVLHHHERMDGTGYPRGLAGEEIPEVARIVAVADAFDAMTSTRCYRPGRPVAAALEELERCAGTQFDPRMVAALTRALRRHGWPFGDAEARQQPAAGSAAVQRSAADPAALGGGDPAARTSPAARPGLAAGDDLAAGARSGGGVAV
ncbi:HD-GYP domain-containing protein [Streptomyces oryzae]|uniref:HD-GYP domain-containing protein n=1 Tax=Streptomyces oryzae TaxID=1434886 RepID=A0ABS3XB34_9ACTN|nr:HD-GYP domain-containing protein [Streptomyces oryzae]